MRANKRFSCVSLRGRDINADINAEMRVKPLKVVVAKSSVRTNTVTPSVSSSAVATTAGAACDATRNLTSAEVVHDDIKLKIKDCIAAAKGAVAEVEAYSESCLDTLVQKYNMFIAQIGFTRHFATSLFSLKDNVSIL